MKEEQKKVDETSTSSEKKKKPFSIWRLLRNIGVTFLACFVLLYWNLRCYSDQEPDLTFAKDYKAPTLAQEKAKKPRCSYYKKSKKNLYWGDFHVHTTYSMDAFTGGTRNTPADAYAFAQGKELTLADGKTKHRIDRKLDFMAVTDHAEYFSTTTMCFGPKYRNEPFCLLYRNSVRLYMPARLIGIGLFGRANALAEKPDPIMLCQRFPAACQKAMRNTWKHIQKAAQDAYKRCRFTTFIGYEWTATPMGKHMHRNVIFANTQVPEVPYDFVKYPTTIALWKALDKGCKKEKGCDVIAIPHNSNWSDGRAFQVDKATKEELDLRAKYETLVEIHQAKGNSECLHPFGDDKGDCNFEISINPMSEAFLDGAMWGLRKLKMTKKRWEKIRSSYVRAALRKGLRYYAKSGKQKRNPFKFGFIASTDTHNATPGSTDSKNFLGSHGDLDETPEKLLGNRFLHMNPGGLVAVWAEENTRESIFAALKRRETYGTSGVRIRVRFSQLWKAEGDPCKAGQTFPNRVLMGGDMHKAPTEGAKPRFVVQALMDQAKLARIDIYKATLVNGKVKESLVRLHANDKKQGDAAMCRVWQDAKYDPKTPTLWYARVIEVPTKRWSYQLCEKHNNCASFPKAKRMVRHRAWTSPIWNLP